MRPVLSELLSGSLRKPHLRVRYTAQYHTNVRRWDPDEGKLANDATVNLTDGSLSWSDSLLDPSKYVSRVRPIAWLCWCRASQRTLDCLWRDYLCCACGLSAVRPVRCFSQGAHGRLTRHAVCLRAEHTVRARPPHLPGGPPLLAGIYAQRPQRHHHERRGSGPDPWRRALQPGRPHPGAIRQITRRQMAPSKCMTECPCLSAFLTHCASARRLNRT